MRHGLTDKGDHYGPYRIKSGSKICWKHSYYILRPEDRKSIIAYFHHFKYFYSTIKNVITSSEQECSENNSLSKTMDLLFDAKTEKPQTVKIFELSKGNIILDLYSQISHSKVS